VSDNQPTEPLSTSGETTVALAANPIDPPPPRRSTNGLGRFGRELAGALALGLSVLAIVVLVFQVLAWFRGIAGPGGTMVAGHLGAAVLAIIAQRVADRARGMVAGLAAIAVVAITVATMWFLWWS
jgi:hypothetical protein